ncbi:MAG: hypothetical protein SVK08_00065 [Halobacteriota archaeon]|nr:hypothetical protein [Halobacteriota archaeon]
MDPFHEEEYRGYKIQIFQDTDVFESPREWSNLGVMCCSHKRYSVPNEGDIDFGQFNSWEQVEAHVMDNDDAVIVVPVYMYEHSGIALSTTPFSCRWDSGQLGIIYTRRNDILNTFRDWKKLSQKRLNKARDILVNEVETFEKYMNGDIYGFVIKDKEGTEVDSVWGYYDDNKYSHMISEAKSIIDSMEAA